MTIDLDDAEHVAEARFKLTAHEGDEQRESPIYISFYRGNLPVGQLSLVCSIDPLHEIRQAPISVTIGGASDPEYVLVVTDRSQGPKGAGPFDIFVSKEGEYLNKPLGSFPVAVDAWDYARARLDGFRKVREEPTTEDRIRAAENLGIELWRDLPEDFKRFYWDEVHEHPGASLAIYSQEPYIPWELIKPQRDVGGEEDGFLGATLRIARWKQAVRFPDPLTVTGFSVIAPVYGPESGSRPLPGAQAEAQQLIEEFGAEPVSGERAVVREMLESSKGIQLIHFAGHGDFDPDAAEISVIRLADSALVPRDLSRARLGQTAHPFVFLNACEVGEQGWALTKIGGWAEAFTDIGFSGFIGPYWAVNDRIARKSSLLFYRSLSAGLTVGEAVRQIRLQFYADPDDAGHPSWLAYTLHCQPNIHIQMPVPAVATRGEDSMTDGLDARHERRLSAAGGPAPVDDDTIQSLAEEIEEDEERGGSESDAAPFDLGIPEPRAIDLRKVWKLAGQKPDAQILAALGPNVPVLLSHSITAFPVGAGKPPRVWGIRYGSQLFGIDARTVSVQPTTELLDVLTVGAEAELAVGLAGELSVPDAVAPRSSRCRVLP